MNFNKTYYTDIYDTACLTASKLSQVGHLLGHYNYLTNEEAEQLRKALRLLYDKIANVGADIKDHRGLPESSALLELKTIVDRFEQLFYRLNSNNQLSSSIGFEMEVILNWLKGLLDEFRDTSKADG